MPGLKGWEDCVFRRDTLSHIEAKGLQVAVGSLMSMYREHISVEDQLIFPVAARVLSRPEQISIGKEMAARRTVNFKTDIPRFRKQE